MRKKMPNHLVTKVGLGILLLTLAIHDAKADKVDDRETEFLQSHPGFHGFLTPHPSYPAQARLAGVQGTLQAQVTYTAKGSVESVVVVKSSGSPILDSNVTAYIQRYWRNLTGKKYVHTTTFEYRLTRLIQPAGIRLSGPLISVDTHPASISLPPLFRINRGKRFRLIWVV